MTKNTDLFHGREQQSNISPKNGNNALAISHAALMSPVSISNMGNATDASQSLIWNANGRDSLGKGAKGMHDSEHAPVELEGSAMKDFSEQLHFLLEALAKSREEAAAANGDKQLWCERYRQLSLSKVAQDWQGQPLLCHPGIGGNSEHSETGIRLELQFFRALQDQTHFLLERLAQQEARIDQDAAALGKLYGLVGENMLVLLQYEHIRRAHKSDVSAQLSGTQLSGKNNFDTFAQMLRSRQLLQEECERLNRRMSTLDRHLSRATKEVSRQVKELEHLRSVCETAQQERKGHASEDNEILAVQEQLQQEQKDHRSCQRRLQHALKQLSHSDLSFSDGASTVFQSDEVAHDTGIRNAVVGTRMSGDVLQSNQQGQVHSLQAQLSDQKHALVQWRRRAQESEQALASKSSEFALAQSGLLERLQMSEAEVQKLRASDLKQKATIYQLENDVKNASYSFDAVLVDLDAAETLNSSLQSEIESFRLSYEIEENKLRGDLAQARKELDDAKSKPQPNSQFLELKEQVAKFKGRCSELESANQSLKAELSDMQSNLEESRSSAAQTGKIRETVFVLETHLSKSEQELELALSQVEALQASVGELSSTCDDQARDLQQRQHDLVLLQREADTQKANYDKGLNRIAALSAENKKLGQLLHDKQRCVYNLEEAIEELKSENFSKGCHSGLIAQNNVSGTKFDEYLKDDCNSSANNPWEQVVLEQREYIRELESQIESLLKPDGNSEIDLNPDGHNCSG